MRAVSLRRAGITRLARRDAELYSVQIIHQGAAARLEITDGDGAVLFYMLSVFTGSFVLGANAPKGLCVEMSGNPLPTIGINWREPDQQAI